MSSTQVAARTEIRPFTFEIAQAELDDLRRRIAATRWPSDGSWAPDSAFALISRLALLLWVAVLSGFLAMRSPAAARAPERAAVSWP